jgi:hypothetical protein
MRSLINLIFLFVAISASAQSKAFLENGDSILIFDNHTWKEFRTAEVAPIELKITVKATVKVDDFSSAKSAYTKSWRRWSTSGQAGLLSSAFSGSARLLELENLSLILFDIGYSGDLGCLSSRSEMIVKLENGELIKLFNVGSTDCGSEYQSGTFSPILLDNISEMDLSEAQAIIDEIILKLRDNNFEKIKLTGSKYYTEQLPKAKFSSGNANEFFRQHIWALQNAMQ